MKKPVQTPTMKQPTLEEQVIELKDELIALNAKFEEFSTSMSRNLNEQREEIVRLRDILTRERRERRSRQQNALKQFKK